MNIIKTISTSFQHLFGIIKIPSDESWEKALHIITMSNKEVRKIAKIYEQEITDKIFHHDNEVSSETYTYRTDRYEMDALQRLPEDEQCQQKEELPEKKKTHLPVYANSPLVFAYGKDIIDAYEEYKRGEDVWN